MITVGITCRCLLRFLSREVSSPPWPPSTWEYLARKSQMIPARCLSVVSPGKPLLRACESTSLSLAMSPRWWWWRIQLLGGRVGLDSSPSRRLLVLGRYSFLQSQHSLIVLLLNTMKLWRLDIPTCEQVLNYPAHQLDGKLIEPKVAVPRKSNPKLVITDPY